MKCPCGLALKPASEIGDELLKMHANLAAETDDSSGDKVVRYVALSTVDLLGWELKGRCCFCTLKAHRAARAALRAA